MERQVKTTLISFSAAAVLAFASAAHAEPPLAGTGIANQANTSLQSITGGNEFTFEGGAPMAPGLPSFAGGPCSGASIGASTSLAGVAIGGGKTSMDDSCQRRNWVQTLIGASQHMPEQERTELLRIAIEVMKKDPYLTDAFTGLGYATPAAPAAGTNATLASQSEPATIKSHVPKFSQSCNIVAGGKIDKLVVAAIEAKGCTVTLRGESANDVK